MMMIIIEIHTFFAHTCKIPSMCMYNIYVTQRASNLFTRWQFAICNVIILEVVHIIPIKLTLTNYNLIPIIIICTSISTQRAPFR